MKLSEYKKIREALTECRSRRQVVEQAEKCGIKNVSPHTLTCIYLQELQKYWTETFPFHNVGKRKKEYKDQFFARAEKKEKHIILNMAREDVAPCVLMRFILEIYLFETDPEQYSHSKSKTRSKAIVDFMRHPFRLEHPVLSVEISEAVCCDDIYGPYSDRTKRAIGIECEIRLQKWCTENDIGYLPEEEMRQLGYDKTPDVKLTMPIAVDGFVVNWIESKAMFGDEYWHTRHVKDQIGPYTRRFGPGLVIYWFGYIGALDCQRAAGIALSDRLPKHVQKIDMDEWDKHDDWKIPEPVLSQTRTDSLKLNTKFKTGPSDM
ncbi:CDAN1-interacting nuclease 1-like isoform X2 [Babylonia areolata]|uniref:CDAN1-interacting nuclease 1-like isoform X2 n=1 Tax=Babylonia areolata TaxID=304850 RepID=UPI003FD450B7